AQDEAAIPDTTAAAPEDIHPNTIAGEFSPAKGFDIIKTKRGSLNISAYGLFRFLNQTPAEQTFRDHLGRERQVVARNDINWHRTMIWVSGFFYDPKFRYTITVWSLPTTEQTLVFGLLRYLASKPLTVAAGIGPSLTARSMQGSWPFWAGSDRTMAEEFYRGGFATSFFVTGEPLDRFFYTASINRSLSQLGIPAGNDNRSYAYSASLLWMPTTGEFGPRGGFGDLEHHEQVATRFGISACHAREGRYAPDTQSPRHAQLKLSDGVNPFETGALADTVTVNELDYDEIAFDAGFKYRGFSFQAEYGLRVLSDFDADGPLPDDSIFDHGFYAQAMHMVVPKKLGIYATTGLIFDEFGRDPWEVSGGASFYPYGSRSLRLNLHYIHVEKSPTGSNFGYYTAGQTGDTISMGVDILL
ncbi:MAG TPA: hypothetical protein VEC56_04555, partial [Candidatus Krumholzibacteria bacterium]|nr:hypothetical protein [Candidatus Krumholzibacteria bacterium]